MQVAWHSINHLTVQCTQQLTDLWEEFLLGPRQSMYGRDTKVSRAFDRILRYSGVELLVLPPGSPNLNPNGSDLWVYAPTIPATSLS
jgi:hypothetical protein